MMFELLLDITDRLLNQRDTNAECPQPCCLKKFDEANPTFFRLSYSKLRLANHRIGAHACANQTVPYGTVLLGGAVPGTSCQATIVPSLWDKGQPPKLAYKGNPSMLS